MILRLFRFQNRQIERSQVGFPKCWILPAVTFADPTDVTVVTAVIPRRSFQLQWMRMATDDRCIRSSNCVDFSADARVFCLRRNGEAVVSIATGWGSRQECIVALTVNDEAIYDPPLGVVGKCIVEHYRNFVAGFGV